MVVTVKVGRRFNRGGDWNILKKTLNRARNVLSIQQYMWRTIQYGFNVASTKAKLENKKNKKNGLPITFNHTKKKYIEPDEDINYNIEWLEIKIVSTEQIEQEQYEGALKFFSKLKDNETLKKYMSDRKEDEIDEELTKTYNPKNKKLKSMIERGMEGAGDQSINRFLNEVGIIVFVTKDENMEEVVE